jgi:prolipoprotein diacylglyceryl transferase
MKPAFFPAPPGAVFHLGPLPIRAYALCIILGVLAAVWIADRRWLARGGGAGVVGDVATWAVPFGLVGARIYHVITDPELYFGRGKHPIGALEIWHGGLGIWGAIAFGALGAFLALRRRGAPFAAFADAAAPGLAVAQAIGRWGNYFNQELFGRPSGLPWALTVTPGQRPAGYANVAHYQPTFLYESLWDLTVAGLVIWADRRFRLGRGRAFALYVAAYTAGRGVIESVRIDHANHYLGLRLNDWVSIGVFTAAVAFLVLRRGPREELGATGHLPSKSDQPGDAPRAATGAAPPRPS